MDVRPPYPSSRCVLIVDDDRQERERLSRLLAANGYETLEADNGRIARAVLAERTVDLVVSDIFMPECDGFELIAAIGAMKLPIPVIAMSDHESWTGLTFLDAANDLGAAAVIEKPFRASLLLQLVGEALTAERPSRVIPIGRWVERDAAVPSGLERLGARPVRRR